MVSSVNITIGKGGLELDLLENLLEKCRKLCMTANFSHWPFIFDPGDIYKARISFRRVLLFLPYLFPSQLKCTS